MSTSSFETACKMFLNYKLSVFLEPVFNQPCNRIKCDEMKYAWEETNHWGPCSATCGPSGTQVRQFRCMHIINARDREEVNTSLCARTDFPEKTRPCRRLPCMSYRWETTIDWSSCNETCGSTGHQTRKMACKKYFNEDFVSEVAHFYCTNREETTDRRECNRRPCYSIQWVLTDRWSSCSQTCGVEAYKEKLVLCKNITHDERKDTISDAYCSQIPKPLVQQSCFLIVCSPEYFWGNTSEWSDCSATCGKGTQIMKRLCVRDKNGTFEFADDSDCMNVNQQIVSKTCDAGPCGFMEWGAGDWSKVGKTNPNTRTSRLPIVKTANSKNSFKSLKKKIKGTCM